jgi:hypothetical protein
MERLGLGLEEVDDDCCTHHSVASKEQLIAAQRVVFESMEEEVY